MSAFSSAAANCTSAAEGVAETTLRSEIAGTWSGIIRLVGVERPAVVNSTSERLPGAASRATVTVTSHHATFWDSSDLLELATLATVTPAAGEISAPWNISRLGIAM